MVGDYGFLKVTEDFGLRLFLVMSEMVIRSGQ